MQRVVVFITYCSPDTSGPVSLGYTGEDSSAIPFEADVSFVVEHQGDIPCVLGLDSVISAAFNFGELSTGLEHLKSMELGFGDAGEVDSLNGVFHPGNTLSSTDITITCSVADAVIHGTDRDTADTFAYRYVFKKQSASRVPAQASNTL